MPTCSTEETPQSQHKRVRSQDSEASCSSVTSSNVSLPTPPDGGWGWVVVFASFMVHMIADGCAFSFGVLYIELLDYFGESKSKTAWAGSVAVSVPLITGPIASALTTRYGCRATTIAGALIASFGFVMSAFAPSIEVLCITFGLIAGFGLSMVYVAAVVIVAFYFHKKRAFATGVAVAGSGIGTFIFAPLTEVLIDAYTWKGALIVIGGIMLNMVACGAVFRPLESTLASVKPSEQSPEPSTSLATFSEQSKSVENIVCSGMHDSGAHSLVQLPTFVQKQKANNASPDLLQDIQKTNTVEGATNSYKIKDRVSQLKATEVKESEVLLPHGDSAVILTSTSVIRSEGAVWPKRKIPKERVDDQFVPMYRKDIFYRGSLLRTNDSGDEYLTSCVLPPVASKSASCPNILIAKDNSSISEYSYQERDIRICGFKCNVLKMLVLSNKVKRVLQEMLDVSLLKDIVFVYFCFSSMLLYMWYDVPYVYIADKSSDTLGISHEWSSFLISIIGIFSTIGQIVVGYIGDLPQVNALLLYNVLTSVAGLTTMCVAVMNRYVWLAAYCAGFGIFISGNYALTTIILVNLLGMEKLTNAYGLVMLSEGVANLVGPSIAGYIADVTGSYDMTFYVAGGGIFISGAMLIFIPTLRRCRSGGNANANNSQISSLQELQNV